MTAVIDGSNLATTGLINSGTAQATTSGTIVTFTGIPAGTKRVTMIFNGVSTSGTSILQVQIGSGSLVTSGYASTTIRIANNSSTGGGSISTGFAINSSGIVATDDVTGTLILSNVSGNGWVASITGSVSTAVAIIGGGALTLSGTLDRIALTTVNGTDTFDSGSVNIQYE